MRGDVGFLESMGSAREWGRLWGGVLSGWIGQCRVSHCGGKVRESLQGGRGRIRPQTVFWASQTPHEPWQCFGEL